MKKVIVLAAALIVGGDALYAQKYLTRTGKISFDATAKKSPEQIKAINNEVATVYDAASGELIFQVPVKSFKFEKALMQEHFNENYVESDKYPKADFKGKVTDPAAVKYDADGTYQVQVEGKLTLHGVTKEVKVPGTATVKGGALTLKASFGATLADYKITVPSMVTVKVGRVAVITIESTLNKK